MSPYDEVIETLADYAAADAPFDAPARQAARLCLADSLACALAALDQADCQRMLGPLVPGAECLHGARVPGLPGAFDPARAAFNLGAMIRWLDYNDTWLAAEWGHPSDNFAALLALADWLGRSGTRTVSVGAVLDAAIRAYEIQGVLALDNSFNALGIDHVVLVKIAATALCAALLGCSRERIAAAISHALVDGQALRTYRHWPNTSPRKSWAAGDACARALTLALLAQRGEPGLPRALTAAHWGLEATLMRGAPLRLGHPLASQVIENVLFKVAYPAEFHAQTAVEAALRLHARLAGQVARIDRVEVRTQSAAMRIIDKQGPLSGPADRDHCLQYMVAVALLKGRLSAADYADDALDTRVESLRARIRCIEEARYSRDYLDPNRRSIANALTLYDAAGAVIDRQEIEYPLGHPRRRAEALPQLREKFIELTGMRLGASRAAEILALTLDASEFEALPLCAYLDLYAAPE